LGVAQVEAAFVVSLDNKAYREWMETTTSGSGEKTNKPNALRISQNFLK
jgi:hypothetical protein